MAENDNPSPYQVNSSAIPDVLGVAARYAAALLSGWLIRKGIIADADAELVGGLVLALVTIGYALYRAYARKVQLVVTSRAAPDSVAIVTEPTPPPSAA